MSKFRVYARNLSANWTGYVANVVVIFFLTPFVVRSLGKDAYGVWCLLVALTGHLGLAEIGVRISTGRFINYHLGRGEGEKVSAVVSTSLLLYAVLSLVVLALAAALGLVFAAVFTKVPTVVAPQARWILLLLGANILLGFYSATFGQLLQAADRFDLRTLADLIVLAARTAATVWVLSSGGALTALAAVLVCSSALGCAILFALARWKGPPVRLGLRYVRLQRMRELFGFGAWAFVGNLNVRIIFFTDNIVIGLLLGARQIAFYNIGLMLIEYGRELLAHVVRVLTPDMLKAAGRGDLARLRSLVLKGARFSSLVGVPLFVGLMVLGGEFIRLWMGPEFAVSGRIAFLLALGHLCAVASAPCANALVGLGRVKFKALLTGIEAAANLGLSVGFVLLGRMGLGGVALGTVLPMVAVTGGWQIHYLCRRLGLPVRGFLQAVMARWAVAAVLYSAACVAALRFWPSATLTGFAAKVGVLVVAYVPIGYWVLLEAGERAYLRSRGGRAVGEKGASVSGHGEKVYGRKGVHSG